MPLRVSTISLLSLDGQKFFRIRDRRPTPATCYPRLRHQAISPNHHRNHHRFHQIGGRTLAGRQSYRNERAGAVVDGDDERRRFQWLRRRRRTRAWRGRGQIDGGLVETEHLRLRCKIEGRSVRVTNNTAKTIVDLNTKAVQNKANTGGSHCVINR
jgi:hypothetical protein